MSEEVAERLNRPKDVINDELEKLEVMGLLDVRKAFQGAFSAHGISLVPVPE